MSDEKSFQYAKRMFPLFRAIVKRKCTSLIQHQEARSWNPDATIIQYWSNSIETIPRLQMAQVADSTGGKVNITGTVLILVGNRRVSNRTRKDHQRLYNTSYTKDKTRLDPSHFQETVDL